MSARFCFCEGLWPAVPLLPRHSQYYYCTSCYSVPHTLYLRSLLWPFTTVEGTSPPHSTFGLHTLTKVSATRRCSSTLCRFLSRPLVPSNWPPSYANKSSYATNNPSAYLVHYSPLLTQGREECCSNPTYSLTQRLLEHRPHCPEVLHPNQLKTILLYNE